MEEYGRAGEVTDDNIIRHLRLLYWITKTTDTHSKFAILIAFSLNNGYTNAPHR